MNTFAMRNKQTTKLYEAFSSQVFSLGCFLDHAEIYSRVTHPQIHTIPTARHH